MTTTDMKPFLSVLSPTLVSLVLLFSVLSVYASGALAAASGYLQISKRAASGLTSTILLHFREVDSWHEALGLPSFANLAVELIDLLESETLGLVDTEIDESHADTTEAAPDEEDL